MSELGKRLRELRERARLTQSELAAALSPPVSELSVRNWEKGRHDARRQHLQELARALKTTVGYLVGETDAPHPPAAALMPPARTYDPDEPPVPPGLQRLIDMGVPLGPGELARLLGYADPLNPVRGARGALGWTPGEWLDVLLDERRRNTTGDG